MVDAAHFKLLIDLAAASARNSTDRETRRNVDNLDLFEAMIREAYSNVATVVTGHHILVIFEGNPLPTEIPSADALIFDHAIARAVWGETYLHHLSRFAAEPTETRDALVRELYYGRSSK